MTGLVHDLFYATRAMAKSAGFTSVAVLSLALGIGANTAIFTFVNAALLKPLPYPDAERIVAIMQRSQDGKASTLVHPRSFLTWHDHTRSFESLAIAQAIPVNTEGSEGAEEVPGVWASAELFQVLEVRPFLGRTYTESEARPGGPPVIVLDYGYWQSRFGGDPSVLGKSVRVGESSSTIIGVMPMGFRLPLGRAELYLPLPLDPSKPEAAGSRSFECYGRLRLGITLSESGAELSLFDHRAPPDAIYQGWSTNVIGLRELLAGNSRPVLLLLLAVVAVVLLIACANVAGLLLARGAGRYGELALRASLGASRLRLIQQLFVESLVLGMMGGLLGLLLGVWASRALVFLARDAVAFGQIEAVGLDVRVLMFTFILSIITSVFFGLTPAWQVSRLDLQTALRGQGGTGSGDRAQHRLRSVLVAGEVALAVVLLVGAGLLLHSFTHLIAVRLGFETEHVLTMRTIVTGDPLRRASLTEAILSRVEILPDVRAAGTIQFLPLGGWTNNGPFHFLGKPQPARPEDMESDVSTVSRGYFAAMGIPVFEGREFDRRDRMDSPRVALVNQSFVNRYCRNQNPIGEQILGDWANPKPTEIVGIVGDVRHNGLSVEPRPTVFLSQSQVPGYITYLVVRSAGKPQVLASTIRRAVKQVDRNQPFTAVQPMQEYVSAALARPRLYSVLLGTFAALALVLSVVGLYGLMDFVVRKRTHEVGVRMALGAQPGAVLRSTLGQGTRLVLTGVVIGLAGAIPLTRLVASLLYDIRPNDPITYFGVVVVLTGSALLAIYVPARRASRVDPVVALRYE